MHCQQALDKEEVVVDAVASRSKLGWLMWQQCPVHANAKFGPVLQVLVHWQCSKQHVKVHIAELE